MRNSFLLVITILLLSLVFVREVSAASLTFTPGSKTVAVGTTLTYSVVLNTEGESVNATAATIPIPVDFLEVTSITYADSVVNFWTIPPAIKNNALVYEGVIFNPGYVGSAGTVFSFTVKTKAVGTESLPITEASTLRNDGLGTNILTSVGEVKITVPEKELVEPPLPEVPSVTLPEEEVPNEVHEIDTLPTDTITLISDYIREGSIDYSRIAYLFGAMALLSILILILIFFFQKRRKEKALKILEKLEKGVPLSEAEWQEAERIKASIEYNHVREIK